MSEQIIKDCEARMKKTLDSVKDDFGKQRTGRANPAILDGIRINYYGTPTPLQQTANISVPEPRMIVINPWDKSLSGLIEKAVLEANLGLTPQNMGGIIRLPIPELSEERRKEIVKACKKIGEDGKVAIRNVRRDGNEAIKKAEKDKQCTEDESKRFQERIQKLTDSFVAQIDDILGKKEKEILSI
ncbi:MAG: ribosome recycling factor [Elusimicrobia bacterium RIFOXYB2_FULL_49_7]|nr:MAG: ribosome recycling factor [Elusimicrobia bacterium RIFOXYB2_FULL_49_7]